MSRFRLRDSNVFITGASAGIGKEFARQLAGCAGLLVLVARRRERLEELRDELIKSNPTLKVQIQTCDLSDDRSVIALCDWLEREELAIDLLINNAGLGDMGPFATSEFGRVKEILAVNMAALTLLTRCLLPGMIARKRGAILNVSSSAGFLPIPGFAVYAATKAYVNSFSEAIRTEVRGTNVKVTSLCPGPVETEFTEVARRPGGGWRRSRPKLTQVSVEDVVRAGLSGVVTGKAIVIPGIIMKVAMLLARMTPMPLLRLASRFST